MWGDNNRREELTLTLALGRVRSCRLSHLDGISYIQVQESNVSLAFGPAKLSDTLTQGDALTPLARFHPSALPPCSLI